MKNFYTLLFSICLCFLVIPTVIHAQGQLWGVTTNGGINDQGTLFKTNSDGTNQNIRKHFFSNYTGRKPGTNGIIQASNGKLYGTTPEGGVYDYGVIYEYDPATLTYTKKYDFNPYGVCKQSPIGDLVQANNGKLYGVTGGGCDASGTGVIYDYNLATNTVTNLYQFSGVINGAFPDGKLVLGSNGKIYGTTPNGGLVNGSGVLFEFDPNTNSFTKRVDFGQFNLDWESYNYLAAGSNNKLYGTARLLNSPNVQVLFEFDIVTGNLLVKHTFTNGGAGGRLYYDSNGKLYGIGGDITSNFSFLYEYDLSTNVFTKKIDATAADMSGFTLGLTIAGNGKLYSTSVVFTNPNNTDYGRLLEWDLSTNTVITKASFSIATGAVPLTNLLLASDGMLYGTLSDNLSSLNTQGSIYQYNVGTGEVKKTFTFTHDSNGSFPKTGLTERSDGRLFGLTSIGGRGAALQPTGTIYSIDPTISDQSFGGFVNMGFQIGFPNPGGTQAFGAYPRGVPVLAPNGKYYCISSKGGVNGFGVIFEHSLTISGGITSNLTGRYHFTFEHEVDNAECGMALAPDGKLYGVTSRGGTNDKGVIFEFNPSTFTFTIKNNFITTNGASPYVEMTLASNGKFYGTTYEGGTNNLGVIFEYNYATNALTKIFDFTSTTGTNPRGKLMQATNGKLYGVTSNGGANSVGTLFEYDLTTSTFIKRLDFSSISNGANPYGGLAQSSNGKLYGSTFNGGINNMGVLYEFDPVTFVFTKKIDFNGTNGRNPSGALLFDAANSKNTQTILFGPLTEKTMGTAPFSLTATASSGLPVTYTSSNTNVATISGNTVTIVGVGNSTITVSQAGNSSYFPAENVFQVLTVNKASQNITFNALPVKSYGDPAFALTGTASSGLPMSYSSSNSSVASISGSTITIVGGGSAVITASQSGNANYNAAPDVTQTITVNKANQSINFAALPSKCVGATFVLSATSTSGLPVSYTSSNTSIVSISGTTVTPTNQGSVNITASQIGNSNYNAAANVIQPFTVNAKPVASITASGPTTFCQGGSVTLTANPGNVGDTYLWSTNSTTRSIATSVTGNYSVTVTSQYGCASIPVSVSTTMVNAPQPYISVAYDLCINGFVRLTVTGATGATGYIWSTGQTTSFITVYSAGTYTVTANYAGGCSRATSYTVYACPPPPDPCDPYMSASSGKVLPCEQQIANKKVELIASQSTIYPNPSDGEVNILLPELTDNELRVKIVSQFGEVLIMKNIEREESGVKVETKEIPNGIYFIQLELPGNGVLFRRKIIVSHK